LNYYLERNFLMTDVAPPPTNLQTFADRLKVLAEPKRLLIIHLLMEGMQCNCELGDALQMASNLVSHHLRILREAGFVEVERDSFDARWVYYSLNRDTLDELGEAFGLFFDPARIKPRRLTCGPQAAYLNPEVSHV
jgi:ArsR family transcriptional regulator